jgi:hypothetical protein
MLGVGSVRPDVTVTGAGGRAAKPETGSLLVEAEPVSNRGRLPATGRPQLGQDPRDVDAGGLGGDEQRLADLPVGPALGDKREDFGLTLCEAE